MMALHPYPIRHILIYEGHKNHPVLGPYSENIIKRIKMFNELNKYREEINRQPWRVSTVPGEQLTKALKGSNPRDTLLVVPAGQSTNLDTVFTIQQTSAIKEFLSDEGRGYVNCGSAYWVTEKRVYHDVCTEQPEQRKTIVKTSNLPLFNGIAEGPLCPFPGKKYQVGFFSDAVKVTDGTDLCSIYLSGGGSFIPRTNAQKVKVLVKYAHSELIRFGKLVQECKKWENAAIMVSVGRGAMLLSMFHPYYGPKDIDVETYEQNFPDCGTNWRKVKDSLSPLDVRMRFALKAMLNPLEDMDWT
jgi:glutamine amidotransferase-like uncharacterized protein